MRRKLAAVYVYNSETGAFDTYYDLIHETIDFTHQFDGTGIHVYGRDYSRNIRIEVSRHAEEIFHNRLKHEYVVYLNKDDRQKAVKLISEYVSSRIEIEISYLENQLGIAMAKLKKCKEFENRENKPQIIED